ncbi:hypothetical protein FS749_016530 [Ceratobasidium sp. UAMH 11750]|nr:hypothetical protein FS749_016530 [Ceratobasidium sp. UAMH 11750]
MAPSDSGANPPLKLARDSTENAARLPGPRNLIVCIDGTSNKYGDKNTNVVELHSHIKKSDMQLTYYTSGVGTYAKPSWRSPSYYFGKKVDHGVDLLIAWNFEKVVIAAYRWLSNSYLPGDRIFLFGFSRGAYQIRALAGMIATVGLMFPGNQEQIPFAYELYSKYLGGPIDMASAIMARNRSARVHDPVELSERKVNNFRMTFSRPEVGVHFLGAWDTVSSVGIRRGKLLPLTNRCEHIKYFRHALAMDERRVKFMPEHIERSRNGEVDDNHIKEVWFTGTHSDIGGGNIRNIDLNRGAEPLVWMMNEAEKAGLVVDPTNLGQDVKTARIVPSLTLGWWIFELLPLTRLSSDGLSTTNRPHLGRGRRIPEHHKIHYSVLANRLQLKDPVYKPRATFKRWNWKDAGSQKAALWEGDDKLVKALEIVRTVDDELLKAANPDPHSHDWLNDVKELLYRSDTSAKMIWEHGGLPFLLKIAKFENLKLVREIVEAVLGTHRRRSASPSSLGATLVDRKKESLSAPPSNAKSEDPLVQEGIPRLPDLLLCYTETGPSIPETSAAATKTKKTGNCIWLPKFTHWRHSIEGFLGKTSRINQPSQDMSSDPLNTEVTLKPAGPILVEIALNIVKDLSQEGYSQDIVKTDVVQCLIHLLTLEPSTIGTRDQWLDLILSALEAMAILAHQHGTANSKLPTKRIASVVLALKGEELVALSLRVLRALAADRGSHEYLLQSTFLKFLKHSLSRDDHVSVAEAFHIIAALVKDGKYPH